MSCIYIDQLKLGKEFANYRQSFVWHIFALSSSYEKCRLWKTDGIRIFEGKIAEVVQVSSEYSQRDFEFLYGLVRRAMQISQEKLSDRERLKQNTSRLVFNGELGVC